MGLFKIFLAGTFFSTVGFAQEPPDCARARMKAMEIEILVSNIENRNTTQTPEGGPYKPKRLVCHGVTCITYVLEKTRRVFQPKSPEANKAGFVLFPDIDVDGELNRVIRAKGELESSSRSCRAITSRENSSEHRGAIDVP
jgi:flagellar basal body rod protein FlgC